MSSVPGRYTGQVSTLGSSTGATNTSSPSMYLEIFVSVDKKYLRASALVVLLVRHGVVLEHEEERPHDGGAGLGVGGHGGAGVVGEAGVDAGQAAELLQRVLVRVELVVSLGGVTLASGHF